jgi:predicted small lipoprotein YifL
MTPGAALIGGWLTSAFTSLMEADRSRGARTSPEPWDITDVTSRSIKTTALVALGLAAAIGLGACGRRGPLEPPPGTADRAAPSRQTNSTFAGATTFQPGRMTETTANTSGNMAGNTPQASADTALPGGSQVVRQSSARRQERRSPPPNQPFILDPLL